MLPLKRLEEIKRILTENKQADVRSLAQTLNVTEATIRRDFGKLEREHFLTRTHGGAVLNEKRHTDVSPFAFQDDHIHRYQNIGRITSQFIRNNEVVFLGPGICSRFVARHLTDKVNVTIVTTDMLVAHDCSLYSPNVAVILTGGTLNPTTLELYGQTTDHFLETFYFSTSFFDIDGITMARGYSVSSLNKAFLTQNVLKISKKSFALCPYDRFDVESYAAVGDINLFTSVITNEEVADTFKEYYAQNKIQLFASCNIM